MVSSTDIQSLADQIAREFDPEKIILFGSYANGTSGPDSDVDLLVIISHSGKNWRKASEIRSRVQSRFPLDLLVRDPEEMRQRVSMGDPFFREIATRGIVLHAREHARMG